MEKSGYCHLKFDDTSGLNSYERAIQIMEKDTNDEKKEFSAFINGKFVEDNTIIEKGSQFFKNDKKVRSHPKKGEKCKNRNAIQEENNSSPPNKEKELKWKIGDYCRAMYSEDELYYEAEIISLDGDSCTVEFLGYDESEVVNLSQLKESKGKTARGQQIKNAETGSYDDENSVSGSEDEREETSVKKSYRKKKFVPSLENDTSCHEATSYYHPTSVPPYAPSFSKPVNQPFMPPPAPMHGYSMPPLAPLHGYPMPPPPPMPGYSMPQYPPMPFSLPAASSGNNASIYSMFAAWHLAGYNSGFNEGQSQGGRQKHRYCCCHSIHHCH